MATKRTCDKCVAEATGQVRVDVVFTGAAAPDTPTGSADARDCCDGCRDDLARELFEADLAAVRDAAGRHRAMMEAREEEGDAVREVEAATREMNVVRESGREPAAELVERQAAALERAREARERHAAAANGA